MLYHLILMQLEQIILSFNFYKKILGILNLRPSLNLTSKNENEQKYFLICSLVSNLFHILSFL